MKKKHIISLCGELASGKGTVSKILKEKLNFIVEGLENYPKDNRPIYYIANHSCLMDIFYLSMAVPDNQIMVVSNRIVYKPIKEK